MQIYATQPRLYKHLDETVLFAQHNSGVDKKEDYRNILIEQLKESAAKKLSM